MQCPHCGAHNLSPFGYCVACGKPLSTIEGGVPPSSGFGSGPFSGAATGMAPAPTSAKRMHPVAIVAVFLVLVLILVLGIILPTGQTDTASAIGFRIGRILVCLLVPGLIAFVIAGRKSARKPNLFAAIFCVLGVLVVARYAMVSGSFDLGESADQRVGRLMREAAGTQPVHNSLFPSRRRLDDALRSHFRALVRQNKEYTDIISKMDVSQIKILNTPESFANPESAAGALRQLHDLYDADAAQEVKVKQILADLRGALESSASSASERETLLRGFDHGLEPQRAKRQAVVSAEKNWMDAVDDEYAYAAKNAGRFAVINGHLIINDSEIRESFNTKVRFQESQRKSFLTAQQEFNDFQAQSLKKMGVNPHDIGAR